MIKSFLNLDYRLISLLLLALFPLLKFNVASILIITVAVIGISSYYIKKEGQTGSSLKYFILCSIFPIILIITLLYSHNINDGLNSIQRSLSIMVIPAVIFFFHPSISHKKVNLIIVVFGASCLLLTFYIYFELFNSGTFLTFWEDDITFWENPFRTVLFNLQYVDIHPTYFSMWVLFIVLWLLNQLINTKDKKTQILLLLIIGYFLFTILLFSARGPIIGFVIASFFLMLTKIKSIRGKFFVSVLSISLIILAITQISFLKARFVDEFSAQKFRPPVGNAHTSSNIRIGIYKCVLDIYGEYPILGVGVGDVQDKLDACYYQFHTRVYQETEYNTHSTYFQILLSGGLLGLIIFGLAGSYQFIIAINYENKIYLAFLILIFTIMLFENLFSRMHGAIFYALFNSIFFKEIITKKNNHKINLLFGFKMKDHERI
ncbi:MULTISPECIES: O-antigen ligase [unclassified Arenibacter]|uniref:O-antigen ligase family protein n=1 Tax=unclassified Arenibacter TaxID=2615047 RepID=UPI000E350339|nr:MULTISPECIES: O-antigen ligase family protein [unclassified Arenibacter]MCM4165941.1 hypothetical protein [Arenibacter sp. A80]RFT54448.1 O-antigen ligase domain-containing protein [Arenibacter sp. P308M17]